MGVHAKFYANWTKTVGASGIHTDRQTDKRIKCPILILLIWHYVLCFSECWTQSLQLKITLEYKEECIDTLGYFTFNCTSTSNASDIDDIQLSIEHKSKTIIALASKKNGLGDLGMFYIN